MSNWGGGYVTDIGYIPGFYRQQMPTQQALCCLLNGVDAEVPEEGVHLDIGCGFGFVSGVIAAANPKWKVYGIDFHPGHIAEARAIARDAGLTNLTFLEADLSTLMDDAPDLLPEIDFVTMHGVWSWVPEPVRRGIQKLLLRKLRSGGICHVSYNALPAWSGVLGMQRLLREAGLRMAGRSDRQAELGMGVVKALVEAGAKHLDTPFGKALMERASHMSPSYLAHEFMNGSWQPCFHGQVAEAMADCKLDFVGSANVLENFHDLMLNEKQREAMGKVDDPLVRELMYDCVSERGLRHDIFIRGARRLTGNQRDQRLADLTLALTVAPGRFVYEAVVPAGKATLEETFYEPIANALAVAPMKVRDIYALPDVAKHNKFNPAELLGILVGTDQGTILSHAGAPMDAGARGFNRAAPTRLMPIADNMQRMLALALPAMAGGIATNLMEMIVWNRLNEGVTAEAAAIVPTVKSFAGLPLTGELEKAVETILTERAPVWRNLGLLTPA